MKNCINIQNPISIIVDIAHTFQKRNCNKKNGNSALRVTAKETVSVVNASRRNA